MDLQETFNDPMYNKPLQKLIRTCENVRDKLKYQSMMTTIVKTDEKYSAFLHLYQNLDVAYKIYRNKISGCTITLVFLTSHMTFLCSNGCFADVFNPLY